MTDVEPLARDGLAWLVGLARDTDAGLAWPETPGGEIDTWLYDGGPGIVLTFLEAYRHFGDDTYADLALRGARQVAVDAAESDNWSLYIGVTGMAVALHAVSDVLGAEWAGAAARRAMDRVRAARDGDHWNEFYEVIAGNAGIALGALAVGDVDIAEQAVARFLKYPEKTTAGVRWEVRDGEPERPNHVSHGTMGIAQALASVGHVTGRADLVELAVAGVTDVVARNEIGPDEFLVPRLDPPRPNSANSPYSYGWCHGPTGDAHVFRLLGVVTGDVEWFRMADRCWRTVTRSGLPQRLSPGFWDNNGHCCGTAGVLALACDREVEHGDGLDFGTVLVDDLVTHATVDADGARWCNVEHQADPPELPPHTGWAMGSAGIVRELLRYTRLTTGRDPGYAAIWPDHPPTGHWPIAAPEAILDR